MLVSGIPKVMASATRDMQELGVPIPDIYQKLANLGSGGTQPGNMHRDLQTLLNLQVPMGLQVTMPLKGPRLGTWKMVTQEVLLPHVLFAYMWESQRSAFQQFIQGAAGEIEAFWRAMAGNPQLLEHHVHLLHNYQHTAIPIALHGDGVPVVGVGKSWSKSCDVYSWCSLLGGGRTG